MIGFEPTTDVLQPAVAAANIKGPNEVKPRVRHCCRSLPNPSSHKDGRRHAAPHLGETGGLTVLGRPRRATLGL